MYLKKGLDGIKQFGLIEESGRNANGNYIKFSDGTLICYAQLTNSVTFSQIGSLFQTQVIEWVYPAEFVFPPFASIYFRSLNDVWGNNANANDNTKASFKLMRVTSFANTISNAISMVFAIGRWK